MFYIIFAIYFGKSWLRFWRDAHRVGMLGFNKDELRNSFRRNIWHKLTEGRKERLTEYIEQTDPADETMQKLAYIITYEALNRDPRRWLSVYDLFFVIRCFN